jgi:hypothetical protein
MFIIKTNQIKTWDINSPRRYNFLLKREVENNIPPEAEILNPELLKFNYNLKIKI